MRSVLIAGGGPAGIEALLALRDLAGDRAELTLLARDPEFVYKPELVEEPFGLGPAERHDLSKTADELSSRFVLGEIESVDREAASVSLVDGDELRFDNLLIAVGGAFEPAFDGVITFPGPREQVSADELLGRAKLSGDIVTFVVPPRVSWALPLYELALLTSRRATERSYGELQIRLMTPELSPLALFGPTASKAVREILEARRIDFRGGEVVRETSQGLRALISGERLEASSIVSLPAMKGPRISGLPSDEDGFIPVDDTCRVRGSDDVYAAGDCTNFPVKQGGLATQQADAVAADIAHRLGAAVEAEPFEPILRGKLLTGDETLSLRADVSGESSEASADYLWWPPRKISGRYLSPWLQRSAEPVPPAAALDVEVAVPREWEQLPYKQG